MSRSALIMALSLLSSSAHAIAVTTYTDSAMNADDYSLQSFAPTQTISVLTTLNGGNPGSALEVDFSGTGRSSLYFLGTSLVYDPGTAGAISSIDWSKDGYITNSTGVSSHFQTLLLKQGGDIYTFAKAISTVQGVWHTATATGLKSTDFSLITNLATSAVDPTRHPSFDAGGPIQFGFSGGLIVNSFSLAVERSDNLVVTIHAVPEPTTAMLSLFGLISLTLVRAGSKRSVDPHERVTKVAQPLGTCWRSS